MIALLFVDMTDDREKASLMSPYEERRWAELQEHWVRKSERRQYLPPQARTALDGAGAKVKAAAQAASGSVSAMTPPAVRDGLARVADAALVPTAEAALRLLDLVTDWTIELMDPEKVLQHHRAAGRGITKLADLRDLDLEQLDDFTRTMALKWRTSGAIEGGVMGALAMVPVAGGVAAVGADVVVMHVLSTALATRVAYSYGFDVKEEGLDHVVDRMVLRAYRNQATKVQAVHQANAAFNAAKNRVRRSEKLLSDHRILAALDKLMQQMTHGKAAPIGTVAKGIPIISVVVGAGTNAYVLGDVVHQARLYAQTLHLSEKYALPVPENLRLPDDDA